MNEKINIGYSDVDVYLYNKKVDYIELVKRKVLVFLSESEFLNASCLEVGDICVVSDSGLSFYKVSSVFVEGSKRLLEGKYGVSMQVATVEEVVNSRGDYPDLNSRFEGFEESVDTKLVTMDNRISSIIADSTEVNADAELIDIRNSIDGTVYQTAGDAVRQIESDLKDLSQNIEGSLSKRIPDSLIVEDDLLYLGSDGEIISDGVYVSTSGGGGGGGGSSTFRLLNTMGTSAITVAEGSDVVLEYSFLSEDSDGNDTGPGTAQYTVNGVVRATRSVSQGDCSFNITRYLNSGTNSVKVRVTDALGLSRSLNYTVNLVSLSVTSTFDSSQIFTDSFVIKFTPYGNISKVAHLLVDSEEIDLLEDITASGRVCSFQVPALESGSHIIEVYVDGEYDGFMIKSNTLRFSIISISEGSDSVIITSDFNQMTANQGDLVSINYQVYSSDSVTTQVKLYINNVLQNTLVVDRTVQVWNTKKYPSGTVVFKIEEVNHRAVKEFTVQVTEYIPDVVPATDGLLLHLSSEGRSNSEVSKDVWGYNNVNVSFSNFNWKSNGWISDNSGDTALKLTGDARAVIPYKIFSNDFKVLGKTIEFDFRVSDVRDLNAVVLSCLHNGIGLKITAQEATLYSEQNSLSVKFKEEERVRVAFAVQTKREYRLVCAYVNGILSGIIQYSENDNFMQSPTVNVTMGNNNASFELFTVRVYDTCLSSLEALDNYIGDLSDNSSISELSQRNDIFDDSGQVSYNKISTQLPVMIITGELSKYKGDKKKVSVSYTDLNNPSCDFSYDDCTLNVQGTSSQYYPRKNYKIKLPKIDDVQQLYSLEGTQIPAEEFCVKADYMDSSGAHNTGNAKLIHSLLTEKIPPQEDDDRVRSVIYGFPIAIFHRETPESDLSFLGKYNFNNDKGTGATFGFTEEYPNSECWEYLDNAQDICLFKTNDFTNVVDALEGRYPDGNTDYSHIKDLYDWVISVRNNPSTFKSECSQHFNIFYLLRYYIISEVLGMVDSRAKNMMMATWDRNIWYPIFYDMDTCYGLNNEGRNVFGYSIEYHDVIGTKKAYNGESSVLWNLVESAFSSEIQTMYKDMRNSGLLSYETIINFLNTSQTDKFCEALYNADEQFKYIDPLAVGVDDEGKPISGYLYAAQGSRADHRKWWVYNRILYMDSKYFAKSFIDDFAFVRVYTPSVSSTSSEHDQLVAASIAAVPPQSVFHVVPYADTYISAKFGNTTPVSQRCYSGVEVAIQGSSEHYNDTETIIYGASRLSSLGDLSSMYSDSVDISNAIRLEELILGNQNSDYRNFNLSEVKVGNNKLLKKVDVTNCPNLTGTLDLGNCSNIQEIYAENTSITAVTLPDGGYLSTAYLPATITNLKIVNHSTVESLTFEGYENLRSIRIENCPTIDVINLVNHSTNLNRVRLIGINISIESSSFLSTLETLQGIDESDNVVSKAVVTGSCTVDNIGSTSLAHFREVFPDLEITARSIGQECIVTFVNYDNSVIESQVVEKGSSATAPTTYPTKPPTNTEVFSFNGWDKTFNNVQTNLVVNAVYTSSTRLYTVKYYNGGTLLYTDRVEYEESSTYGGIRAPSKTHSSSFYVYEFNGWDKDTSSVTQDMDVYAVFREVALNTYTVTFRGKDGAILKQQMVPVGSNAAPPSVPVVAPTAKYTYTFKEWSPGYVGLSTDTDVYATYTENLRTYTVTYLKSDGSVDSTLTVPYGASANFAGPSSVPITDDPLNSYNYFVGWSSDLSFVAGDITVSPIFESRGRLIWSEVDDKFLFCSNYGAFAYDSNSKIYNFTPDFVNYTPISGIPFIAFGSYLIVVDADVVDIKNYGGTVNGSSAVASEDCTFSVLRYNSATNSYDVYLSGKTDDRLPFIRNCWLYLSHDDKIITFQKNYTDDDDHTPYYSDFQIAEFNSTGSNLFNYTDIEYDCSGMKACKAIPTVSYFYPLYYRGNSNYNESENMYYFRYYYGWAEDDESLPIGSYDLSSSTAGLIPLCVRFVNNKITLWSLTHLKLGTGSSHPTIYVSSFTDGTGFPVSQGYDSGALRVESTVSHNNSEIMCLPDDFNFTDDNTISVDERVYYQWGEYIQAVVSKNLAEGTISQTAADNGVSRDNNKINDCKRFRVLAAVPSSSQGYYSITNEGYGFVYTNTFGHFNFDSSYNFNIIEYSSGVLKMTNADSNYSVASLCRPDYISTNTAAEGISLEDYNSLRASLPNIYGYCGGLYNINGIIVSVGYTYVGRCSYYKALG